MICIYKVIQVIIDCMVKSKKLIEGHILSRTLNDIHVRDGIDHFQQQVFEHAHEAFC